MDGVWEDAIVPSKAIWVGLSTPEDHAEQSRDEIDGKDVVGVEEEADTGDEDGSNI